MYNVITCLHFIYTTLKTAICCLMVMFCKCVAIGLCSMPHVSKQTTVSKHITLKLPLCAACITASIRIRWSSSVDSHLLTHAQLSLFAEHVLRTKLLCQTAHTAHGHDLKLAFALANVRLHHAAALRAHSSRAVLMCAFLTVAQQRPVFLKCGCVLYCVY
jgi:hypothetical protein